MQASNHYWRLVTDGMVKMLLLSPATSTWRDDLQAANGMTCYRSEKNTNGLNKNWDLTPS